MGGETRNVAQVLGERYRLVEQLGAGGMAVVWRGYDEVLGRQVAVKVLASRLASERSFRHRIRIEAQAAARLAHPHITTVYDYGESHQVGLTVPYVVMELVDGQPLTSRFGKNRSLPWREALTIGAEVASALAAAHARGVVHRDVTPGNVMLTPAGVKVVDFGISALVGESERGPDGSLLGTPAYVAPERLNGGQVSPATDVYAVGLLLYRMLTGRHPWDASTTTGLLRAHVYAEPAPMPPVPGLPDGVPELVRDCLAKHPEDRPTSVDLARRLAEEAGVLAAIAVSPAAGPADPIQLAHVGTTILPWSAETDALPSAITGSRRAAGRRRRVKAAVVVGGLLAVTGAGWGFSSQSPASGGQRELDETRMTVAGPEPCRVSYALRKDDGQGFSAEVTLTNTSRRDVRDWTMRFDLPGNQTVTGGKSASVRQQGRTVVVGPVAERPPLRPGASADVVVLTGRYVGTNPLPVEFRIGEHTCAVQVSGVAGASPSPLPEPATTRQEGTKPPAVSTRPASGGGDSTARGGARDGDSTARDGGRDGEPAARGGGDDDSSARSGDDRRASEEAKGKGAGGGEKKELTPVGGEDRDADESDGDDEADNAEPADTDDDSADDDSADDDGASDDDGADQDDDGDQDENWSPALR